jgi:hypothetical protein
MDWDLLPDSGDQAHCDVRSIVNPSVGGVQTLHQPPFLHSCRDGSPGVSPCGQSARRWQMAGNL